MRVLLVDEVRVDDLAEGTLGLRSFRSFSPCGSPPSATLAKSLRAPLRASARVSRSVGPSVRRWVRPLIRYCTMNVRRVPWILMPNPASCASQANVSVRSELEVSVAMVSVLSCSFMRSPVGQV